MGNIGKEKRRIEVLPVTEPAPGRADPVPQQPQPRREPEPTR